MQPHQIIPTSASRFKNKSKAHVCALSIHPGSFLCFFVFFLFTIKTLPTLVWLVNKVFGPLLDTPLDKNFLEVKKFLPVLFKVEKNADPQPVPTTTTFQIFLSEHRSSTKVSLVGVGLEERQGP